LNCVGTIPERVNHYLSRVPNFPQLIRAHGGSDWFWKINCILSQPEERGSAC
jgi:hypothetical protein